jgi:hypothetical protein
MMVMQVLGPKSNFLVKLDMAMKFLVDRNWVFQYKMNDDDHVIITRLENGVFNIAQIQRQTLLLLTDELEPICIRR